MKLKSALKPLKNPTGICKVCFKDIHGYSFRELFGDVKECTNCFCKKEPIFFHFKTNGVKALAIYGYDEILKAMIFQLKGCNDIELAPTFLESYAFLLRCYYPKHFMVCAPSFIQDNQARGFNHVEEIFKPLKLAKLDLLTKISHHKQSDQLYKDRSQIKNHIKLANNQDLQGKRILLVDDIYTTGSTINTCIDLIKSLHPKSIEVLVLCKVMTFEKQ